MPPVRALFPLRSSRVRLVRPPSSVGIEPVSELLLRKSVVRLDRSPSSAGIEPVSELTSSRSSVRLDSSPSFAGIEPARLLETRFSEATRLLARVTPFQLAIAVPVSQLSAVPAPTSVASAASSASQSSTKPPLVTDEPPTATEPAQP